jgi:serine/threonine protein kinase/tetratricopeptide (TPR) repeat protein
VWIELIMNAIEHRRLRELFEAVMDLPRADRAAYLDAHCAKDPALRAEIDSLLLHHDADVPVLADDQVGIGMKVARQLSGEARGPDFPDRIGAYRIVGVLGSGGMGIVYEAEQEEPIRRRVALKVIKLGMDTQEVVARFGQERQALAMLDHPNIAKVFDAGATESGRPYFVMELCLGRPITEYCDSNQLSIAARLGLFVQVCQAIQHAHQKALIHRDIKPSNVLVTTQDGQPFAKVIDFGIAKATAGKLAELTLHTEAIRLLGTPEYMSPEQAEGSRDIDTRTDVYSLGVLLYELLTGCTPFSSKDLRSASNIEIQRIIRDVDPITPSTRIRRGTGSLAGIAEARRIEPNRLADLVRGDLDWIVVKALEKDRERRYASAGDLGADIGRHLSREAVLAAPPSAAYRFRKLVARNRSAFIGAAVVAAALVIGLAGTLWQAGVARREARAEKARSAELKQVADLQAQMFSQIDVTDAGAQLIETIRERFKDEMAKSDLPPAERAAQVSQFNAQIHHINATDLAAELIDAAILKPAITSMEKQLSDQPAIEAFLNQTLADLYRSLGRYKEARPLQDRALAQRRQALGDDHPDTIASMQAQALLLRLQGEIREAEQHLDDALSRARRVLGEEHPTTLAVLSINGGIFRQVGRLADAEACWREVLEKRRRVLGDDHADTMYSINNMGYVLQDQGRLEEAGKFYREALEKRRRILGEDHRDTLISLNFVGYLLVAQGKLNEAEPFWREALEKRRRTLGDNHPQTINSLSNMGDLLQRQGRLAEAEPLLREAYEKRRRVLGAAHPLTLASIAGLAGALEAGARWNEAEPLRREAATNLARSKGIAHPETVVARMQLGGVLLEVGRFAEAETELTAAHQSAVAGGPAMDDAGRRCIRLLVRLYDSWDRAEPHQGHGAQRDHWKEKIDSEFLEVKGTNEGGTATSSFTGF